MTDFSTCRRCRGLLQVTNGDVVHPLCAPVLTRTERLREDLVSAIAENAPIEIARLEDEIAALEAVPPNMLNAALRYVGWGWPVFPLKPGTKEPDTPHGFKDASVDAFRVQRYWQRHPDANIGVPTGAQFDVIDVDAPKRANGMVPGAIAYEEMLRAEELPDSHGMVTTANAGLHLYIEPIGKGSTTNFRPSLDYRGTGGYVVVPPSATASGRWTWLNVPSPVIRNV